MTSERVFLWGWFGFENVGDDLLLQTVFHHLSAPARKITVAMARPYTTLPSGITQVHRSYAELFRGALHNDVLIIGPGGLFPFDSVPKLAVYLAITAFWKMLGRKVIFWGVGISERMSSQSAFLWRRIIANSDLFITRSPGVLRVIGVNETETVHTMADAVFSASLPFVHRAKENCVVVSPANLSEKEDIAHFQNVVSTWASVIRELLRMDYQVDVVSFTKGADEEMASAIVNAFEDCRERVRYLDYEHTLNDIEQWSSYSFSVCMRFHSLVLSVLAGVPPLPIAYGHKTQALAKTIGLEKYGTRWNCFQNKYFGTSIDVSAEEIIDKMHELIREQNVILPLLQEQSAQLIASATNAAEQLKGFL